MHLWLTNPFFSLNCLVYIHCNFPELAIQLEKNDIFFTDHKPVNNQTCKSETWRS